VLALASGIMIFGGLPLISLCHQAINDRRILNRGNVSVSPGVDLSSLHEKSSAVSTDSSVSPFHLKQQVAKSEGGAQQEFAAEVSKVPFRERVMPNLIDLLLRAKILKREEQ
jgi:hypothetical protein